MTDCMWDFASFAIWYTELHKTACRLRELAVKGGITQPSASCFAELCVLNTRHNFHVVLSWTCARIGAEPNLRSGKMSCISDLPPEIMVHIFGKLGSIDILRSVMPVCKNWYWLIQAEVEMGRAIKYLPLDVDNSCILESDNVSRIVAPYSSSTEVLEIVGYESPEKVKAAVVTALGVCSKIKHVQFRDCNASLIRLNADEFQTRLVSLQVRNSKVSRVCRSYTEAKVNVSNTGNRTEGATGCPSWCRPLPPLFYFLCYIHFSLSVDKSKQNLVPASKLMLMVLPSSPRISQAHCSIGL